MELAPLLIQLWLWTLDYSYTDLITTDSLVDSTLLAAYLRFDSDPLQTSYPY